MAEEMSPRSRDLREMLLATPSLDRDEAVQIASDIANHVVELLNGHPITIATHLLANALICRALTEIGAHWWSADFGEHPIEDTRATLLSIQTDPPASIKGRIDDIREKKS